jgi:hypothetical protein
MKTLYLSLALAFFAAAVSMVFTAALLVAGHSIGDLLNALRSCL